MSIYTNLKNAVMIRKMICIAVCAWMCACCEKNDGGGVLEPVEPPIEKPEKTDYSAVDRRFKNNQY